MLREEVLHDGNMLPGRDRSNRNGKKLGDKMVSATCDVLRLGRT